PKASAAALVLGSGLLAEKHDDAAVGRPSRTLVEKALGQEPLARAVRANDADEEAAAMQLGERDQIAAWRPDRRGVATFAEADPLRIPARCAHHVKLLGSAAVRIEDDFLPVRRVAGRCVDRRMIRQLTQLSGAQIHYVDFGIAVARQTHDHAV